MPALLALLLILFILNGESFHSTQPSARSLRIKSSSLKVTLNEAGLLLDKTLDTLEDVALHFKRLLTSPLNTAKGSGKRRPVVVVLGSGWSAHCFLKVIDTDKFEVKCISPRPYFIFTPMLTSAAVGTTEFTSIVESIRSANPLVDFIEGEAKLIDTSNSIIQVESSLDFKTSRFNVTFDHLVYAVGSQVSDFNVPGVREHCCFIKEIQDVRIIKQKICDAFERASLPGTSESDIVSQLSFVIVGGGPTGVEFAGELTDFLREDLARIYPRLLPHSRVILLNSGANILTAFDLILQQKAVESLRSRGIDIRLNTRVTAVHADRVCFRSDEGTALEISCSGLCVWAAGNTFRPVTLEFAKRLGPEQEESVQRTGRLAVDKYLRLRGNNSSSTSSPPPHQMFAMGDASRIISSDPLSAQALPQTAQVAAQQGAYLARLLNRGYNTSLTTPQISSDIWWTNIVKAIQVRGVLEAKAFQFLNLGLLAYVGDYKVL